jgi:hypothetical protein
MFATPTGVLGFMIAGNQNIGFNLMALLSTVASGASGGMRVGMNVPSGASVRAGLIGTGTGTNFTNTSLQMSASPPLNSFCTASGPGVVQMDGVVIGGSGVSGVCQPQFQSINGATGFVLPGTNIMMYASN